MTPSDEPTRPISVAELLAKNGSIGSPPAGGRRRRRRGNDDAVSVAELTGEIPVVRDVPSPEPIAPGSQQPETQEDEAQEAETREAGAQEPTTEEAEAQEPTTKEAEAQEPTTKEAEAQEPTTKEAAAQESAAEEAAVQEVETEAPETEGSESVKQGPATGAQAAVVAEKSDSESDAEQMMFDPVDESAVLLKLATEPKSDSEAAESDPDLAELQSYLRASGGNPFSDPAEAADEARGEKTVGSGPTDRAHTGKLAALWRGSLVVFQSILAVLFGAGLFIAFDQLWRWNNIVALVLSVLVILGLVVAVRVVRKTEDIASTLIAVAVGALVTLGPLALLQSV
jgi:hypothetical protein